MPLVIPEESQHRMSAQEAEAEALAIIEEEVARNALKLCPCGRMFKPYRSYQKFCTDAHRVKYGGGKHSTYERRPTVTRQCKNCGADFDTNDNKRHYCSQECYADFQAKRRVPAEHRTCMKCGADFVTTHWLKRYCNDCRRR